MVGYPDPPLPYTVAKAFPDLKVKQPLYVLEEPEGGTLLVLQHLGAGAGPSRLLRIKNDPGVKTDDAETVLDMDRLSMGMAFHPDFAHNGYLYIFSNGPVDADNKQDRISRFTVGHHGQIEPKSEVVVLEWDSNGHNGGDLAFGPDGYLYAAGGDGTSDSDANLRGQDLHYLTSAMIRIDVDHPEGGKNYSVPEDNPFLQTPGARPEIWAYGFRNPWRLTYDLRSNQLWVGQNGQDMYEQVYLVRRGENCGWSRYEGSHPFNLGRAQGPTPITPPTAEHSHREMRSLTGGVVYHGTKFPELDGAFIYGDFSTGRIWGIKHDGAKVQWNRELARTTLQITSFRELASGDLLVVDHEGALYGLTPSPRDPATRAFPRKLSETGLFSSVKGHVPHPGLIPYSVNAPLWSDGAAKERFLALPPDTTMDVSPTRGWDLPEGAVLVKSFSLEQEEGKPESHRYVETRLLTKQQGQWAGYSYVWNDEQTEATLVEAAGLDRDYTIRDASIPGGQRVQRWHYPSRTECMVCHTRASNFVLGINTLQLDREHDYGPVRDNQLRVLEHLGLLHVDYMTYAQSALYKQFRDAGDDNKEADRRLAEVVATRLQREPEKSTLLFARPETMKHLVDPYDPKADLELRARSYLQSNCAICHVDAGGGNSLLNLEFDQTHEKMRIFDVAPQHDTFGIEGARLVAAGHPENSILYQRLMRRGQGQMPPLATSIPDEQALKMLREWIEQMKPESAPSPQ